MKKYAIANDDMMVGLTPYGKWRGLCKNWAGHLQFRDPANQWMLFDSAEKAEQYLIRFGYCKSVGDRDMENYCFIEKESW